MSTDLKQKTEAELAQLAAELGLELNTARMSKKALIEAIAAKQAESEPEAESETEAPAPEEPVAAEPPKPKKYRIIIHNQEGPENTPFVKVGVNGRVWQINREEPVVIPEEVKHALDNAVVNYIDATGAERRVQRFPVSILGLV